MRTPRTLASVGLLAAGVLLSACAAPAATSDDALRQTGPAAVGSAASRPADDVIIPECRPSLDPIEVGAVGSFAGPGLTISDGVATSDISGVFCAIAKLVPPPPGHPGATACFAVTAPPGEGVDFDPLAADITKIPGVRSHLADVAVRPDQLTALICNDGLPGPLALDTTVLAAATPDLFGTACQIGPLKAHLEGTLTGPLDDLAGTLTSPPLTVDAVLPSPECPPGLASSTNDIVGLPGLTPVGLSLEVHVALWLPRRGDAGGGT